MSVGRLAAASMAASLFAATAGAQAPGTLEIGGYGQYNIFDEDKTGIGDNEIGVGGRVGVFFHPRWSVEGEASYTKTDRGLPDKNDKYAPIALRLNYHFPFATNSAFILGGGVTRSDFGTTYTYGPSALAGFRFGLGRVVALRIDGTYSYLPDPEVNELAARAGLSVMIPGSQPMTAEQQAQMGGAPQPGTIELGGFGQYSFFDDDLNLENAFGYGARIGAFVTPMIEPEVDFSYTEADADRGNGSNLRVVPVAARLNFNFPFGARNAFILGGGATRTFFSVPGARYYVDDNNGGSYNWGASGLAGLRIGFGQRVALRVDGIADYLPEPELANFAVRAGLSLMLGGARPSEPPPPPVAVVDTTTPPPPAIDSTAIRDSIARAEQLRQAQEQARSALQAVIYFDFDRSNIRSDAAGLLDAKIPYLQANPQMRIRVVGNTDTRGSDEYNLALGQRRAAAARTYLVQHGIDASRIDVASRGEENPVVANATQESEHQQNRRDEFEIVVGGENIMVPGMENMAPPSGGAPMSTTPGAMPMDSSAMMRDTTGAMPGATPTTPPDTTATPAMPMTPDTTATPATPPVTPDTTATPTTPGTPTIPPTTPDTTATPGMPMTPTTPPDTTATPGSTPTTPPTTPPATPPTRN